MSKIPLMLVGIREEDKLPYGKLDKVENLSGFEYDSKLQVGNTITMGETKPTTTSQVATTTGVLNRDSDESNDDEGTD